MDQIHNPSLPADLIPGMRALLDAETGIIGRVVYGTSDGKAECLPICAAATLRRSGNKEVGFGKALTAGEAMIGAIGEALEIYASSQFSAADLILESLDNLGATALDPRDLCLYEDSTYNRPGFPYARFEPTRAIHWVRGSWLPWGEPVWVPAWATFRQFPSPPEERFCQVTSNGLAAGLDLSDATFRAVLELVERDAFMLSWYCRLPGQELKFDGRLEPEYMEILDRIRERGADVRLYLLHAGIVGAPTVLCLARGNGKIWPGATLGIGSHLSLRKAAHKAILELGQTGPFLCSVMTEKRRSIPTSPDEVRTFQQHAMYYVPPHRSAAFDFLSAGGTVLHLEDWKEPDDISLGALIRAVDEGGVRLAVADLTSPDLKQTPFCVVRALGTNFQQIHCGFGLERTRNPRLRNLLTDEINNHIHPLC
jgi:ribosomal protein S12 methylthiotransferase accessory factor